MRGRGGGRKLVHKQKSRMSVPECKGTIREGGLIRQFKGVENFLKRVAFNLGNTPSQTEVKIISCIPIDVSDLQQKILFLEKQLDEKLPCAANEMPRCLDNVVCQCDMKSVTKKKHECPALALPCDRYLEVPCERMPVCGRCSKSSRKSNVSFQSPCEFGFTPHSKKCPYDMRYVKVQPFQKTAVFLPGEIKSKNRKTYRRNKLHNKNKKHASDYVYFAQTSTSSPFNRSKAALNLPKKYKPPTNPYLSDIINKQFIPKPLGLVSSEISKFSSPICRDVQNGSPNYIGKSDTCSCCRKDFKDLDDDVLKLNKAYKVNQVAGGYYDSTLYDVIPVKEKTNKIKKPFDMSKKREFKPTTYSKCLSKELSTKLSNHSMSNPRPYLHSSLKKRKSRPTFKKSSKINRRTVKVKDFSKNNVETNKICRQFIVESSRGSRIKSEVVNLEVMNNKVSTDKSAENAHKKCKTDAECLAKCISKSECQSTPNDGLQTEKTEIMLIQIKNILQSVLHEIKITTFAKGRIDDKQKKDAVVQKEVSSSFVQKSIPQSLPTNLAADVQDDLPSKIFNNYHECRPTDKETKPPNFLLKNIQELYEWNASKNLLYYAGTTKKNMPNALQGNVFGFGLPHQAYSLYNANTFLPSCSIPLNADHSCSAPKYFPNFPVFYHPSMRPPMCTGCCRPNPEPKGQCSKKAITTATNTERVQRERSKETEQLIKDIYKTMAINMGVVQIDNKSLNEYKPVHNYVNQVPESAKKESTNMLPVKEVKKVTNVVQAVSELFRKSDYVTSLTPDTTAQNLPIFNKKSHQHEPMISSTENFRKERLQKFFCQAKTLHVERGRPEKELLHEQEMKNQVSHIKETLSSTDTEFDATYTQEQPKEHSKIPNHPLQNVFHDLRQHHLQERKQKTSLLNKVFNTVKMLKPKSNKRREIVKVEAQEIEESSSDSDEYETIYSKKIKIIPKPKTKPRSSKSKDRSKVTQRSSPYMEQEYRRHWIEKLMFDDHKFKHSSDISGTGCSPSSPTLPTSQTLPASPTTQNSPNQTIPTSPPVYSRIYETRTSCVEGKGTQKIPSNNRVISDKQAKNQSSKMESRRVRNGISLFKKSKISTNSNSITM